MAKHIISSKKNIFKEIFSYLIVIVSAAAISILFRIFLFEPFIVPTPSMETTLMVSDRVIVNKFSYKYKGISRGDVIVFNSPVSEEKDLVKRAIAFEGETVTLGTDGNIYINDELFENDIYNTSSMPQYSGQTYKIGADEIFVMGDNRNNSYDSRFFGAIQESDIFGKVFFIYWPVSHIKIVR